MNARYSHICNTCFVFLQTGRYTVTLDKAEFSFKKKEIEVTKKAAQLAVPMAVAKAGKQEIEFKGSFSVCNDTSCKIMRNEVFKVTVEGK